MKKTFPFNVGSIHIIGIGGIGMSGERGASASESAPTSAWVVDTGNPSRVATSTVLAAASATAAR